MRTTFFVVISLLVLCSAAVWADPGPIYGGQPVTSGQTLSSTASAGVVSLADGSTFTLDPNSQVVLTLDAATGKWTVNLLKGGVSWRLTAATVAGVSVQGRALSVTDKEGYARLGSRKQGVAAAGAAAGGAAAGATVGLSGTSVAIIAGATLGVAGLAIGLYEGLASSSPK